VQATVIGAVPPAATGVAKVTGVASPVGEVTLSGAGHDKAIAGGAAGPDGVPWHAPTVLAQHIKNAIRRL
jgi:hypothetical protein